MSGRSEPARRKSAGGREPDLDLEGPPSAEDGLRRSRKLIPLPRERLGISRRALSAVGDGLEILEGPSSRRRRRFGNLQCPSAGFGKGLKSLQSLSAGGGKGLGSLEGPSSAEGGSWNGSKPEPQRKDPSAKRRRRRLPGRTGLGRCRDPSQVRRRGLGKSSKPLRMREGALRHPPWRRDRPVREPLDGPSPRSEIGGCPYEEPGRRLRESSEDHSVGQRARPGERSQTVLQGGRGSCRAIVGGLNRLARISSALPASTGGASDGSERVDAKRKQSEKCVIELTPAMRGSA